MDSFEESMHAILEKFKAEYYAALQKEAERLIEAGLSNEEVIAIVKVKTSKFNKQIAG